MTSLPKSLSDRKPRIAQARSPRLQKKTSNQAGKRKLTVLIASAGVSSLAFLCYLFGQFFINPEIPYPVVSFLSEPYSIDLINEQTKNKAAATLPCISDYLAHMAFQEGFAYGAKYGSSLAAGIDIPQFTKPNASDIRINKTEKTVRTYDDAWVWNELALIDEGSVEKMLVTQNSPANVRAGSIISARISGYAIWITILLFLAISVFAHYVDRYLTFHFNYAKKSPIHPRSKLNS
jgi:hypothetical protein